jgi:hypothetical protein
VPASLGLATTFAPATSFAPAPALGLAPSASLGLATTFAAPATTFAPAAPTNANANAIAKYSSLKNGSKPTYRELNHSIINKPMIRIENKEKMEESDKHKMFEKIKSNYRQASQASAGALAANAVGANVVAEASAANAVGANVVGANVVGANVVAEATAAAQTQDSQALQKLDDDKYVYIPKRKLKKTTRTCKYRLGKLGNKVSVLIKDYKTRKNIQNECYKLEKTSLTDIKNFLRKRNLLKVGSVADEGVLREMYENCILAGDIENKNKDTLIHNFLAKV